MIISECAVTRPESSKLTMRLVCPSRHGGTDPPNRRLTTEFRRDRATEHFQKLILMKHSRQHKSPSPSSPETTCYASLLSLTETSSTLMLITIPPWLRQKADHARRPVDLDPLTVLKPGHHPVDAHDARLSVLARDHRTVL